jgi:all-trans-8'-apo-beta-carotenal 15,15'-oxygenase
MMHDIAYTDRHVIAFVAPIKMKILGVMLGMTPPCDALRWLPELGTTILVAPLDDLTQVRTMEGDARFFWHVANAYETDDGAVVDTVLYDDFSNNELLASVHQQTPRGELFGKLSRTHLNFTTGQVRHEELCSLPAEFPIVAPSVQTRRHQHVYMAAHGSRAASGKGLHDRIVSFDVARRTLRTLVLGSGLFPGEPIFVPREGVGEASGYLLTLVYDAKSHESHVAVIDAERLEDGPIAKAHFGHHVPFGFHGTWVGAND